MGAKDEGRSLRMKLYINMFMMLCSGTALSIIVQYQNATSGYEGEKWRHPYFQSFVASFGHLGGFLVYWAERKWFRKNKIVFELPTEETRKIPIAQRNNMIIDETIEVDSFFEEGR